MGKMYLGIIRKQLWKQKQIFIFYFILKLSYSLLVIINPLVLGKIIDCLTNREVVNNYHIYAILFSILSIALIFVKLITSIINIKIDSTTVFLSSQAAIKIVMSSNMESLLKYDSNYISSRIVNDTRNIVSFILNNLVESIFGIVQLIGLLVIIYINSVLFFIVGVVLIPICLSIYFSFKDSLAKTANDAQDIAARYSSANQKQFANYQFIKLNGLYNISRSYVEEYYKKAQKVFLKYRRRSSQMDALISATQTLAIIILLFLGGNSVVNNKISIGIFITINAYYASMIGIIGSISMALRNFTEAKVCENRMDIILREPKEYSGKYRLSKIENLTIKNLKITYLSNNTEQFCISEIFKIGKLYCIKGNNGTGKSTFIKTILGGYTNYTGNIEINGKDLKELDIEDYRESKISYMPQQPLLFFETSDGILSLGSKIKNVNNCREIASSLLEVTDIDCFINDRLKSKPGNIEDRFSGGEKQKIAFACACGKNSDILIVDEPTSAIDEKSKHKIASILKEQSKEKIVICITHDIEIFKEYTSDIICLN